MPIYPPNLQNEDDKLNPYTVDKINNLYNSFSTIKNIAIDVKDDITSTFKPYKSSYYSLKEWKQPFVGLAEAVGGSFWLAIVPLLSTALLFVDVFNALKTRSFKNFLENIALTLLSIVPHYLMATTYTLRGLTQVIATPLILAKKILRNFITLFSETPKIETLNSTVKLVKQGEALLNAPIPNNDKMQNIILQLHDKYSKERVRHVPTDILVQDELRAYVFSSAPGEAHQVAKFQRDFLGLFKKRQDQQPEVENAPEQERQNRYVG